MSRPQEKEWKLVWAKFRVPWSFDFYHSLKGLTPEQIEGIASSSNILKNWTKGTGNENTWKTEAQMLLDIASLPESTHLFFPHWIMDRFKEALGQYVRGEYWSSIALCGAIVEFITKEFLRTYDARKPSGENQSKGVKPNLLKLRDVWTPAVLNERDYCLLYDVRDTRDKHEHLRRLRKEDYACLKSDNLRVLLHLCEFFDKKSIEDRYGEYLAYAASVAETAS